MLSSTFGSKGGLYAWEQVRQCSEVILVEGLFDYAVLWQAGFHNLTCSLIRFEMGAFGHLSNIAQRQHARREIVLVRRASG
ncbi:MAG: toprim domain-containing protein [Candidatus Sulfotelmatobacter sp.]